VLPLDQQLARFIERQPSPGQYVEDVWVEQERRAREEARRLNRIRWAAFHRDQAERLRRTMEPLVAFHEGRAELLEREVSRRGPLRSASTAECCYMRPPGPRTTNQ
jgi:hypothetical protein